MVDMTRKPTPKEYDTGYYMKSWLLEGCWFTQNCYLEKRGKKRLMKKGVVLCCMPLATDVHAMSISSVGGEEKQ